MNDSIDRFNVRAIRENANVKVRNHPAGVHGFDNQNDDDQSREIVEFLLAFARRDRLVKGGGAIADAFDTSPGRFRFPTVLFLRKAVGRVEAAFRHLRHRDALVACDHARVPDYKTHTLLFEARSPLWTTIVSY
jgi:hypothetical protein